ncbi:chromosome condensation regulator repeat protein [Toxoplasma gondii MAS]|uniref:Chromosome condensation regulator repeat protein n=1 Tax=Toxoplasma gondii MAS TaxID=943118 RepID=A0A086Q6T9_TOXGO|nr:chromosome condensation regulator repeat protein [Toxoplasma gondii MAS]
MPGRGRQGRSPELRGSTAPHSQRGAARKCGNSSIGENEQGWASRRDTVGCLAFPFVCPARRPPQGFRSTTSASGESRPEVGPSELLFACLQQLQLPECLHLLLHHGADPFHQPLLYSDEAARSLFNILPKALVSDHFDWECPSSAGHVSHHQTRPSPMQLASRLSALLRSPPRKNLADPYMERCFLVKSVGENSVFPPTFSGATNVSLFRCLCTWGAASSHQLGHLLFSSASGKRTHPPRPVHFSFDDEAASELFCSRDPQLSSQRRPSDPLSSAPHSSSPSLSSCVSCPPSSKPSVQPSAASLVCSACSARARNGASSLRVQLIRCGASISLAATFDGEVWVWGKGGDGGHQILSEPTLLRGLVEPLESFSSFTHGSSRGKRSGTCGGSPRRSQLISSGREQQPEFLPKAGDACYRCGCTFLDDTGKKHTRGRIIRDAAVGASHCLLLVDVAVAERPGLSPEETMVSCGRRTHSVPKSRGSNSDESEEALDRSHLAEGGTQFSCRRREPKGDSHDSPSSQRIRRRRTNSRAYPGGGPLPPVLEPLSFDALRSNEERSGPMSEDSDEGCVGEEPVSCKQENSGNVWVYRNERRLYAWGYNSSCQLGFSPRKCRPNDTAGHGRNRHQESGSSVGSLDSRDVGDVGFVSQSLSLGSLSASEDSDASTTTNPRRMRNLSTRQRGDEASEQPSASGDATCSGTSRETKLSETRLAVGESQTNSIHRKTSGEAEDSFTFRPVLLCSWKSAPLVEPCSPGDRPSPAALRAESSLGEPHMFSAETETERKWAEGSCRSRRQTAFGSSSASHKEIFGGRRKAFSRSVPLFPATWKVDAVAAGLTHSLLLLDDGRVCVFGDNTFGQCAQPPSVRNVKAALVLSSLPPCTAIAAGQNTNMSISRPPQKVFVWGGSRVAGSRIASSLSVGISDSSCAPSSSCASSASSSASTCAVSGGRGAPAILPFFSPMRLKGVGRREDDLGTTQDGWTTQTTSQGCPVFSTDTLAVNDSVGLAVGADERIYIFHCGVRPPIVFPAVPLLSTSDVSESPPSPQPCPSVSRSRGAPAVAVSPSAPNGRVSSPPVYLHLPPPRTSSSPSGGVWQMSLSSSQIFLLTGDGLLYCAPIPEASAFTRQPGKENDLSRRGCASLLPANPKETQGRSGAPSLSSVTSLPRSVSSFSNLSPFILSPSMPEPLPPEPALCLPPSAHPGLSFHEAPGLSLRPTSGVAACESLEGSPTDLRCKGGGPEGCDGDKVKAIGPDGLDRRRGTNLGPPREEILPSAAPWSVFLHFTPVREAASIGSFACSENHIAVIVEIHSPQFPPYTRPALRSSPVDQQVCAAIRASFGNPRHHVNHNNIAPFPSTSSGELPPSTSPPSPRGPTVSACHPPSLAACAAQALLRPKPPFPASVGHVLETVAPLAVSLRDKSLFDFCCLFLLFNLPLLVLALHRKTASALAGPTTGLVLSRDIPALFETLGSAKRICQFSTSSSSFSPASCESGDVFLPATAGMQYILRSFKAAVTTAYLDEGTDKLLALNLNSLRDPLNPAWVSDPHDALPRRNRQERRDIRRSPSLFSSFTEWSPSHTAPETASGSDDDWAAPSRPLYGGGTHPTSLTGSHEAPVTSGLLETTRGLSQPLRQRCLDDEQLANSVGDSACPSDIPAIPWWVEACAQQPQRSHRCEDSTTRRKGPRLSHASATTETAHETGQEPETDRREDVLRRSKDRRPRNETEAFGSVCRESDVDRKDKREQAETGVAYPLMAIRGESSTGLASHMEVSLEAASSSSRDVSSLGPASSGGASSHAGMLPASEVLSGQGGTESRSVSSRVPPVSSVLLASSGSSSSSSFSHEEDVWTEEGRQAVALWTELMGSSLDDGQSVRSFLSAGAEDLATVLGAPLPHRRVRERGDSFPRSQQHPSRSGDDSRGMVRGDASRLSSSSLTQPFLLPDIANFLPYENILFRLPRRASDLLTSSENALLERRLIDQWSGAFWVDDKEGKARGGTRVKEHRGRQKGDGRRPLLEGKLTGECLKGEDVEAEEIQGPAYRGPGENASDEGREQGAGGKWRNKGDGKAVEGAESQEGRNSEGITMNAKTFVDTSETKEQSGKNTSEDEVRNARQSRNATDRQDLNKGVDLNERDDMQEPLNEADMSNQRSIGMLGRWTTPFVPAKDGASEAQVQQEGAWTTASEIGRFPSQREERNRARPHDNGVEDWRKRLQTSSPAFAPLSPSLPPSSFPLSSSPVPHPCRPSSSIVSPALTASLAPTLRLSEAEFPCLSPVLATGRLPNPRGSGVFESKLSPVGSQTSPPKVAPLCPLLSASPSGHTPNSARPTSRWENHDRQVIDRKSGEERTVSLDDTGLPVATPRWSPDERGGTDDNDPSGFMDPDPAWNHVENRHRKQSSVFRRENGNCVLTRGEVRKTIPGLAPPCSHPPEKPQQSSASSVVAWGRGIAGGNGPDVYDAQGSSLRMPRPRKPVTASTTETKQVSKIDIPASLSQRGHEVETAARGRGDTHPSGRGFALEDFLVVSHSRKKKRKNGKDTGVLDELKDQAHSQHSTQRPGPWNRGNAGREMPVPGSASASPELAPVPDLSAIMREEELLRQERALKFQLRQSQALAQHPSSVVRVSGPPSVVVVSRQSATASAALTSGTVSGTAGARSRPLCDRPAGPGGARPSRPDAASFNRWGREAALRLQGEEGFCASDLTAIQREQIEEQEEDLARRQEEAELQEALRLIREMEERERQQEAAFQREIRRAAVIERRRIEASNATSKVARKARSDGNRRGRHGASHHLRTERLPYGPGDQIPVPSQSTCQGHPRRGRRPHPVKSGNGGCESHPSTQQQL